MTLEPCDHHGRTPPCSEAILAAGIRRVVAAVTDPHRRVGGRGFERLCSHGIEVSSGLLAEAATELNRRHFLANRMGRAAAVVKTARTLDGRTALPGSVRLAITGPEAALWTHRRRSEFAAVLVGSGTLLADDPLLNARSADGGLLGRQPARIVVDARLRTPPGARLLHSPGGPVRVITSPEAARTDRARRLEEAGAGLLAVAAGPHGGIDPLAMLRVLAADGFDSILVEGGPHLVAALARADLVDLWHFWLAPRVLGAGRGVLVDPLEPPLRLGGLQTVQVGGDLLVSALPPGPA